MKKHEIIKKVLKDEPKGIKDKFFENPKEALQEMGIKIPNDWKVVINRIDEKTLSFDIPKSLEKKEHLTDEEIELASGGMTGSCTLCGDVNFDGPNITPEDVNDLI